MRLEENRDRVRHHSLAAQHNSHNNPCLAVQLGQHLVRANHQRLGVGKFF